VETTHKIFRKNFAFSLLVQCLHPQRAEKHAGTEISRFISTRTSSWPTRSAAKRTNAIDGQPLRFARNLLADGLGARSYKAFNWFDWIRKSAETWPSEAGSNVLSGDHCVKLRQFFRRLLRDRGSNNDGQLIDLMKKPLWFEDCWSELFESGQVQSFKLFEFVHSLQERIFAVPGFQHI